MRRSAWKRWLRTALYVVVCLALVFYCYRNRSVVAALTRIDPASLGLMLLANVAMQIVGGVRYQQLLKATGYPIRASESCILTFWFAFFNLLLPMQAGLAGRALYLRQQHGIPLSVMASLTLANNALVVGAAGAVLLVGNVWAAAAGHPVPWAVWATGGVLAVPLAMFAVPLPRIPWVEGQRVGRWMMLARGGWNAIRTKPAMLSGSALLQCLFFLLTSFCIYLGYRTIGIRMDPAAAFGIAALATASRVLNLTPGNLGLQELIISYVGSLTGAAFEEGMAAALVVRAAEVAVILPVGAWSALWVARVTRRAPVPRAMEDDPCA